MEGLGSPREGWGYSPGSRGLQQDLCHPGERGQGGKGIGHPTGEPGGSLPNPKTGGIPQAEQDGAGLGRVAWVLLGFCEGELVEVVLGFC